MQLCVTALSQSPQTLSPFVPLRPWAPGTPMGPLSPLLPCEGKTEALLHDVFEVKSAL